MGKLADFFSLDGDVIHLILMQVHNDSPSSLLQFAKASKDCEKLAGPLAYGSITLSDQGEGATISHMRHLFGRLLNKNDILQDHVRDLRIAEWGGNNQRSSGGNIDMELSDDESSERQNQGAKLLSSSNMEIIIGNLKQLHSFRWDAKSKIPKGVMAKLEDAWPNARLYVTNNPRYQWGCDNAMDVRLLSSPLLYALNYSILFCYNGNRTLYSEFGKLKDIISRSPKLKELTLEISLGSRTDLELGNDPSYWHPSCLPFDPTDKLLTFHTLQIPGQSSYYGKDIVLISSAIFAQAKDFTHLSQVKLANLCGAWSFEPLKGRVPNLKHLEFCFEIQNRDSHAFSECCRDPTLIRDFIDSIDALEHLRVINDESDFHILWPAILKHRGSLQRLAIHTPPDQRYRRQRPPILTADEIGQLQECCIPNLELDVLVDDATWSSKTISMNHLSNSEFDPSVASVLASSTRLESLKIYIELPTTATVFSKVYNYDPVHVGDPVPPLIEEKARDIAVGLFQQIYACDPHASLQVLEICFVKLEIGDRMDSRIVSNPVWVRKVERDFINHPSDPGFIVEFQGKWKLHKLFSTI